MTERQTVVEIGKPHPISLREIAAMDKKQIAAYKTKLSGDERFDFNNAVLLHYLSLSKDERKELERISLDRLQQKEHKTIGDRVDIALTNMHLKNIVNEKPPILFRKFRQKPFIPQWLKDAKSPYLINAPVLRSKEKKFFQGPTNEHKSLDTNQVLVGSSQSKNNERTRPAAYQGKASAEAARLFR